MQPRVLLTADEGENLLYREYRPAVLDEGKKYPLLIFLHGFGERGDDNRKQMTHCADDIIQFIEKEKQPAFLIMPQCPDDMRWVRYVRPITSPPHRMDRYPTLALQMAEKLIEQKIAEEPIDANRVYVAGLSMGGFATWELLSRRPDLFAAGVPVCGGGDPAQAKNLKGIPLWVFHGGADKVVTPDYSKMVVEAIRSAPDSAEVKYTEYPGVGHDSWTLTFKDPEVLRWIFRQRRN